MKPNILLVFILFVLYNYGDQSIIGHYTHKKKNDNLQNYAHLYLLDKGKGEYVDTILTKNSPTQCILKYRFSWNEIEKNKLNIIGEKPICDCIDKSDLNRNLKNIENFYQMMNYRKKEKGQILIEGNKTFLFFVGEKYLKQKG